MISRNLASELFSKIRHSQIVLLYLTLFIFYTCLYNAKFSPLGITNNWYLDSNFGDLQMNLNWIACSRQFRWEIYDLSTANGCGGFTYGYLIARLLGLLGVNGSWSSIIGNSFFIIFVLVIAFAGGLALRNFGVPFFLVIAIFVSPGFWLAIVHGSLDIVVFILLFSAFILSCNGRLLSPFFLVLLTAHLKFFTLPLLYILTIQIMFKMRYKLLQLLIGAVLIFTTFFILLNMSKIDWEDPNYRMAQGIFFVFGIESLPNWVEVVWAKFGFGIVDLSQNWARPLGIAALLFLSISFVVLSNIMRSRHLSYFAGYTGTIKSDKALLFFGVPFLSLFLQGQNYDNKLIFASMASLALYPRINTAKLKLLLNVLLFVMFWFSCFFPDYYSRTAFVVVQFLGDCATLMFVAILSIVLFKVYFSKFTPLRIRQKLSRL